jgi:WD40 repeat protein
VDRLTGCAFAPDGQLLATAGDEGEICLWEIQSGALRRSWRACPGRVESLAFSPDGRTLATAGAGSPVRLWDVKRGELLRNLSLPEGWTSLVAFSPDGRAVVGGGMQDLRQSNPPQPPGGPVVGVVAVWDAETGKLQRTLPTDWSELQGLAVSPDGRQVAAAGSRRQESLAGWDGEFHNWDLQTGGRLSALPQPGRRVFSLRFSPDTRQLVTTASPGGEERSEVSLWDCASGRWRWLRHEGANDIPGLALSPDGRMVATAGIAGFRAPMVSGVIHFWEAATGRLLHTARLPATDAPFVAFSPDGRWLAATGGTIRARAFAAEVRLWNLQTRTWAKTLGGQPSAVSSADFSPDGRMLAFVGGYNQLLLWDRQSGQLEQLPAGRPTGAHRKWRPGFVSYQFLPGSHEILVSGSRLHGVGLWRLHPLRRRVRLGGGAGWFARVVCSPDGRRLAAEDRLWIDQDRVRADVLLWDRRAGRLMRRLREVQEPAFTRDGKYLVGLAQRPAGEGDRSRERGRGTRYRRSATLWDAGTGARVRPLGDADSYTFAADGRLLIMQDLEGSLTAWDVARRGASWHLEKEEYYALSRAGRVLATASSYGPVTLRNPDNGNVVRSFPVQDRLMEARPVESLALSPVGDRVALGRPTGEVTLLDLSTGEQRSLASRAAAWRSLNGSAEAVTTVGFSPYGWTVLGSTRYRAVSLWEAATGRLLQMLPPGSECRFSGDGTLLAAEGTDGLLRLYDTRTGRLRLTVAWLPPLVPGASSGRWVAFTPEGYYDASRGADRFLRWRLGDRLLKAEACSPTFHRPDLVRMALQQ